MTLQISNSNAQANSIQPFLHHQTKDNGSRNGNSYSMIA